MITQDQALALIDKTTFGGFSSKDENYIYLRSLDDPYICAIFSNGAARILVNGREVYNEDTRIKPKLISKILYAIVCENPPTLIDNENKTVQTMRKKATELEKNIQNSAESLVKKFLIK